MPDRIRVLLVDDEPLARRGLTLHLDAAGGFDVVGEAATSAEAVNAIRALRPDAVFLDVQMPGGDGFSVVEAIGSERMPVTVFVTAYDEHALRAFDAHAVDYVLKPVDPSRFARAAERVRSLVHGGVVPRRVVLRDGPIVLVLDPGDIDWIAADGDYVRVYTRGRGHLIRHTLSGIEARLDSKQFTRVHRSALVNVARVREVKPEGDRAARVVLVDGTVLRASRGYRQQLIDKLAR